MDKFVIQGGARLEGEIATSGSKNSALPAIAACLLTDQPVTLRRIPRVRDIRTMERLLVDIGAIVDVSSDGVVIRTPAIRSPEAPYELVKTMRASSLVLGPLVARAGRARVSLPGGCAIGARPIDLHIRGFEKLGATVTTEYGYVEATAQKLKGASIVFEKITVTGTENLMMAAALAEGQTTLMNSALEPEITDLADLLNSMGAKISGAGTSTITIDGVSSLHGASHSIIPDRIETGTFLAAGAMTDSDLELTACNPGHLTSIIAKMREAGANIEEVSGNLRVRGGRWLRSTDMSTYEYPGFATDMQAQYMALMTQASGIALITENIFENRFMHASELVRMGANIRIDGSKAVVAGKSRLTGAKVIASDLRASASLVLAGLVAEGETIIDRIYHLDRGYEKIEEKLRSVGAQIERLK